MGQKVIEHQEFKIGDRVVYEPIEANYPAIPGLVVTKVELDGHIITASRFDNVSVTQLSANFTLKTDK